MRVIECLRRAPAILRTNSNYRWFIISRMLTRVGQIAEPFYLIYPTEALGCRLASRGSSWQCVRLPARCRACCGVVSATGTAISS
jgi:hypothetical protein